MPVPLADQNSRHGLLYLGNPSPHPLPSFPYCIANFQFFEILSRVISNLLFALRPLPRVNAFFQGPGGLSLKSSASADWKPA